MQWRFRRNPADNFRKSGFVSVMETGIHDQGCARLMNRESNLTRLKWVESELSRQWKSRIWVSLSRITLIVILVIAKSTWCRLSQNWVHVLFLKRKEWGRFWIYLSHYRERTSLHLHSTVCPLPPTGRQLLDKLIKMWCVVSQIWLNSDLNELSRSWVMLANLRFKLSQSLVNQEK